MAARGQDVTPKIRELEAMADRIEHSLRPKAQAREVAHLVRTIAGEIGSTLEASARSRAKLYASAVRALRWAEVATRPDGGTPTGEVGDSQEVRRRVMTGAA